MMRFLGLYLDQKMVPIPISQLNAIRHAELVSEMIWPVTEARAVERDEAELVHKSPRT